MKISEPTNLFYRLIKRAWKSTALWMVTLLICVDFASHFFNPMKYLDWQRVHPFQLTQSAINYKFSQLLSSRQSPDILIMGSSLMMSPIFYYDGVYSKTEMTLLLNRISNLGLNGFQSYPKAIYFTDLLKNATGKQIKVFNMTTAACMASDAHLILSKIIAHSKQPKLLLYAIGPRDFSDNLMPPLGATPTFKILADWSDLPTLGLANVKPNIIENLAIYSLTYYYRVRDQYRALALEYAANLFNHPRDMAEAEDWRKIQLKTPHNNSEEEEVLTEQKNITPVRFVRLPEKHIYQNLSEQLADYDHRYNPPDRKRFTEELHQFADIVKMCKKNKIILVVVNMPITLQNKLLIRPQVYSHYMSEVENIVQRENIPFFNFQDAPIIQSDDFLDSVHLNAKGGRKFENSLAEKIVPSLLDQKLKSD
jgi:hypothetical protein